MSRSNLNTVSDEEIRLVKSLLDSNVGDPARLRRILDSLQRGVSLDISEQEYLQEISKTVQPPNPPDIPTDKDSRQEPPTMTEDKEAEQADELHPGESWTPASRKKIAIVASVIAALIVAYVGLDVYSVGMLEFRPHSGNQYPISPTEIHIQADVCNPSFFPATFNKYEISAFYNSELIEKAELEGNTVSPKAMSTLDGVFALNTDAILRLKQENASFDPTLAKITTTVDAPIFGAIPFSVVKEYSAAQFQEVLKNGPPGSFSCY